MFHRAAEVRPGRHDLQDDQNVFLLWFIHHIMGRFVRRLVRRFLPSRGKSHIRQRDYHTGLVVQPDRRSDQAFDLVPGIRRDSHLPGHGHQSGHADQRRQMAGCGLRRLLLVFSHTGCSHVAGRKLHIRSSGKAGHVYGHRRSGNPSAHWRKEQKRLWKSHRRIQFPI